MDTTLSLEIVPYNPSLKSAFKSLNIEWITHYFRVEPEDERVLDFPEENILATGGAIFFALLNGEAVGCCGLLVEDGGVLELVKMAVQPKHRGLKIGEKLCKHAIEYAQNQGTKELYLISNRKLLPALALYRKVGFVEVPIKAHDLVLFERCDIRMSIHF